MTKEQYTRRSAIFQGLTAGAAMAPIASLVATAKPDWRQSLIDVIVDLENLEGWEMHAVALAKAHAAGEIRKALGMEVPESSNRDEFAAMTAVERAKQRTAA